MSWRNSRRKIFEELLEIAIEYNINKSCKNIYKYDDILLDEIKLKIER